LCQKNPLIAAAMPYYNRVFSNLEFIPSFLARLFSLCVSKIPLTLHVPIKVPKASKVPDNNKASTAVNVRIALFQSENSFYAFLTKNCKSNIF
jgi:hypothetical protein